MRNLGEVWDRVSVNVKEITEANDKLFEDLYQRFMRVSYLSAEDGMLELAVQAPEILRDVPLYDEVLELIKIASEFPPSEILEERMTNRFFLLHFETDLEELLYYLYAKSIMFTWDLMSPELVHELFEEVLPDRNLCYDKEKKERIL